MATVILIVFLVALAALGKWWLSREKRKQRKKLESDLKIAQGKIEEVPVEDAKIERSVKWPDTSGKAPPQTTVPSAQMMQEWSAQAADAVDKLLQAIHAHKAASAAESSLKRETSTAENRFDYNYPPSSPSSAEDLSRWLENLLDCHTRHQTLEEKYEAAQVETLRLMEAAKQAMVDAWYCCEVARRWDLSKADDNFMDVAEMTAMVVDKFDATYRPPRDLNHYFQLRPQGARTARRAAAAKTGNQTAQTVQTNSPEANPEVTVSAATVTKAHAVYDEALAAAREALEKTFPRLVNLHTASQQVQVCSAALQEVQPVLMRLNKPVSADIDHMLEQALLWSQNRQQAESEAAAAADLMSEALRAWRLNMKLALRRCKADLPGEENSEENQDQEQVQEQVRDPANRIQPQGGAKGPIPVKPSKAQQSLKTVLVTAAERLNAQGEHLVEKAKNVLDLKLGYTPDAPQSQSLTDACNQLRKLMRKVIGAVAQTDAAQSSLWTASRNSPALLHVSPPELTQSSVAAFINTHARMVEMTERNQEKTRQHKERLDAMKEQFHGRQSEEKEALRQLTEALPVFRGKARQAGPALYCLVIAAEVVLASYSEKKRK